MEKEHQKENRWSRAITFIVSYGFFRLFAFTAILLTVITIFFTIDEDTNIQFRAEVPKFGGAALSKSKDNTIIEVSGERTVVSKSFPDISQACWFYHDNYTNLHPYTITWNKTPSKDTRYPEIRVIAESAFWKSRTCIQDKEETYLLGDETVNHIIEARFAEDRDFVRIATSTATYRSKLFFDPMGRPFVRKVVTDEYRCRLLLPDRLEILHFPNQRFPDLDCKIHVSSSPSIITEEIHKKEKKEREKEQKHINSLIITLDARNHKIVTDDYKTTPNIEYIEALKLYINERKNVHDGLAKKGCGVIAFEPELGKTDSKMKPAIAFLCFKDEVGSHVRLMMRE
ncbi:hypothetical protein Nit79A3_1568 [Nitrosomonas sp. Is79A3]|uniref:hypothetical protein n=1 Tax=Nitrosomonas sp. (strain Is79A3) TaxID=261292 RepID=UPI000215D2D8